MRMMRTDPAETGGLFVGRRPGTAPIRFRELPRRGSTTRQRLDGLLSGILLAAITGISLLCWGPIPAACLWTGSQIDYLSNSVFVGIVSAFMALFPLLFGALWILHRLDRAWILTRRAAGHDQRAGVMARVMAVTAALCALAFSFWFLVIQGPGSGWTPPKRLGLSLVEAHPLLRP